ncbi:putative mfs quinate protein [Phaeoacremonium minimum UCRPA7]|uniref:Putative mfs quinate protein n=1 Tax=Phaeoacremonium minimum (strain UCR-PA7) TaxID=1286976 RepID=R8BLW4_PHAM7|nr:putative mfs quinate protein [Phaeoacremonium minimum UCRPA7]EOO00332.1 putative mfs quinate protein [Phaeoacremonium minimum UCRPA7]
MLVSVPYGVYFIFASVNFVMAILAFWIPETKGISLERMDELFGGADLSHIEDVGVVAQKADVEADLEKSETVYASKH